MSPVIYLLLGCIITGSLAFAAFQRNKMRIARRAQQLTLYLEAVNCGKEGILSRCEDEFSHLEDELYKTVSELRIAGEQARRARMLQADNLADIAHQLKTPITSMSLMTQLLADGANSEDRDCLDRISSQLDRLEQLTASLLTMSRLDAEAIVFEASPTPFAELMARACEPMELLMHSRGQQFVTNGGETEIKCDGSWTSEALLNLIKNCSEHTPQGGQITASCSENPLYTQITIEDSGCGFDPDELPRLFNRFYRGKNAAKDSIGIGLALAKSIITGQGGMIRAENRSEGGARFVIRFYG